MQETITSQSLSSVGSGRFHLKIVADIFLIWLDEKINVSNVYYKNIMPKLCQIVNMFKVFTDRDQCVDFLTNIRDTDIYIIISEEICQQVVPLIHDFNRLQSVFILRRYQKKDEQWIKNWSKINGIYTEILTICDTIKRTPNRCEQNANTFSLLDTSNDLRKTKLNQLNPMFMYSQILAEILLDIPFKQQHFTVFIDYCRQASSNNDIELQNIDEFEKNYCNKNAIQWYTSERFLYTTLNRGLRIVDADTIIKMAYFIANLYQQIEQLHREQYCERDNKETFILYRGQVVAKTELDNIIKTKGGLIAFNSFLSTSRKREVSCIFAGDDQIEPDLAGILFIITVEPSNSSAAFASIRSMSQFPDEDEVLFVMHTVFRIIDVKPMSNYTRIFEVELQITKENDQDLTILRNYIQEEIPLMTYTGWNRLAMILFKMGLPDKAQHIYETQLDEVTEDYKRAMLYNELGSTHTQQGKYKEAIDYYEKALVIQQSYPSNHSDIASSYHNIGAVYHSISDYSKALMYYEKALAIRQQLFPSNHIQLTKSYDNIGNVYFCMSDYSKALLFYEKALAIGEQSLPTNHPDLASFYGNIGNVHKSLGDYLKALSFFEKALAIGQQSLPSNHPQLAISHQMIGTVYYYLDDHSKALSFCKKALAIHEQILHPNHPDLAISYQIVGILHRSMGDYSNALLLHERALAIQEQSLPANHPNIAASYDNIGGIYYGMRNFSKALLFLEKALATQQQVFPANNLSIAASHHNIGVLYHSMGDYSKALCSFEKSLIIRKTLLPSKHPDIASSYDNMGILFYRMNEYSKARSCFERAIEILQYSLPSDHRILTLLRMKLQMLN